MDEATKFAIQKCPACGNWHIWELRYIIAGPFAFAEPAIKRATFTQFWGENGALEGINAVTIAEFEAELNG